MHSLLKYDEGAVAELLAILFGASVCRSTPATDDEDWPVISNQTSSQ